MTTISIRLNEKEQELYKGYANFTGRTLSELFKSALAEKIEDEFDYKIGLEALEEFEKNSVSYSHEEVCKMLGLENV